MPTDLKGAKVDVTLNGVTLTGDITEDEFSMTRGPRARNDDEALALPYVTHEPGEAVCHVAMRVVVKGKWADVAPFLGWTHDGDGRWSKTVSRL